MDSTLALADALSRPIRLSVCLEDSQRLQELEERCETLRRDHDQIFHRWQCCASVCRQLRDYCASIGLDLPSRLDVTPWE